MPKNACLSYGEILLRNRRIIAFCDKCTATSAGVVYVLIPFNFIAIHFKKVLKTLNMEQGRGKVKPKIFGNLETFWYWCRLSSRGCDDERT